MRAPIIARFSARRLKCAKTQHHNGRYRTDERLGKMRNLRLARRVLLERMRPLISGRSGDENGIDNLRNR